MKIKMRTIDASAEGIRLPGEIYDVNAKEAKSLIDGGYAEAVREVRIETADATPIIETTDKQKRR